MEHSLPEKYQRAEIYDTLGGDVFIARRESGVFEIPFMSSLTYLLSSKHNEMNLPGYYQSMLMYVCMYVFPILFQKGQNLTHSQVLWLFKADPVPIFYKL